MDPITIMALLDAGITLVEKLAPKVQELFNNGEITAEQQQTIFDRMNKLRESGFAFTRPEGT